MENNASNFFTKMIYSKDNLMRGLILFFSIALLLIVLVEFIFYKFEGDGYELNFNQSGAVLIQKNNKLEKAQFLFPASSRWTNTGIKIKKDQNFKVIVSGTICVSANELLNSLENTKDILDLHRWMGVSGKQLDNSNPANCQLIEPKANLGNIIAYIETSSDVHPGPNNLRPKGLFVIDEQIKEFINSKKEDGTLWLSINDIYFDSTDTITSKKALFGRGKNLSVDVRKKLDDKWKLIKTRQRWDVLFDDNIGEFLINIDFQK